MVAAEAEASVALLGGRVEGRKEEREKTFVIGIMCVHVCLFCLQTSNTVQCCDGKKEKDTEHELMSIFLPPPLHVVPFGRGRLFVDMKYTEYTSYIET